MTRAVTVATLALVALAATSASAATPATTYDATRIESFEPQDGGRFADRMASAGDLNGDGVGDFWLSAYSHDVGGLQSVGRIWAVSGRTRSPLYSIDHPEPQNCLGFACGLGWSISNLGDIDGDGINDVVAGANRQNVGANASQGKAYVFSGAPGKSPAARLLYELNNPAPQANGYFGWASRAGDVVTANGTAGQDGISEILVGAFQNDVDRNASAANPFAGAGCGELTPVPADCRKDQGQSFIFNGAPTLQGGASRLVRTLNVPPEDRYVDPTTQTCESGLAQQTPPAPPAPAGPTQQRCGGAGIVNEGVGDVNGDGFWDQSVTAWTTGIKTDGSGDPCLGALLPPATPDPSCNERQGRIYIFSGADGALLRKIDNPVPQQQALFGLQIVQAGAPGDVNGDGFDDVYGIGFQQTGPQRGDQPGFPQEGRAWVFSGQQIATGGGPAAAPFNTPLLSLIDPTPEQNGTFGYSLAKTDYNRDGRPDLYIGSFAGSYVFLGDGTLQKVFDLPAEEREPGQPPGNTNLGRSVAAPGDLNGDGEPDYVAGSPGHFVGGPLVGRAYAYLSRVPAAQPPGQTPPPPPPPPPAGKATAKLSLARATIDRRDRMLDVLAPITSLASGRVNVELHAAGRRFRFTAAVNSADGRIRFRRRIPAAQARIGTGILTIAYRGDADTRPQTVRLRAANQKALLRPARPTIASNGRLRAAGTVDRRARGVVRVQLEYVVGADTKTHQFLARINNGRWSLNQALSQTIRDEIARRTATVHSYTLFTGYLPARMRGEMRSYQVLGNR